jgi:hypothetical protein
MAIRTETLQKATTGSWNGFCVLLKVAFLSRSCTRIKVNNANSGAQDIGSEVLAGVARLALRTKHTAHHNEENGADYPSERHNEEWEPFPYGGLLTTDI